MIKEFALQIPVLIIQFYWRMVVAKFVLNIHDHNKEEEYVDHKNVYEIKNYKKMVFVLIAHNIILHL